MVKWAKLLYLFATVHTHTHTRAFLVESFTDLMARACSTGPIASFSETYLQPHLGNKQKNQNLPQTSLRPFLVCGCPAVCRSCGFPPVYPLEGAPPAPAPSDCCHLSSLSLFITHFALRLVPINTTALAKHLGSFRGFFLQLRPPSARFWGVKRSGCGWRVKSSVCVFKRDA